MTRGRAIGRARRKLGGLGALSLVLPMVMVGLVAAPAAAATFTNSSPITIPTFGNATPYPSQIPVSGLGGTIVDVNVTLNNYGHTFPDDVDVLLVSPASTKVLLMVDVGGGNPGVSGLSVTFDQASGSVIPDNTNFSSGTYRPSIGAGGAYSGAGIPAGPNNTTLNAFNGQVPTGTWSLFVFDDFGIDAGSISAGWTLDITTNAPTCTSFSPTSGPAGTSVQINGTNFTGATSVTFGGTPAAFVVNSSNVITATVPAGAPSGSIVVTTPSGTATCPGTFTGVQPPSISSVNPPNGRVGDPVTILGSNFTGTTSVTFNGVAAAFTVASSGQINTTVPAGASTGSIVVTTPGGTANSSFTVKHVRGVTLHFSVARGNVTVLDGFNACRSGVPVKLQHRVNGNWRTVASGVTNPNGSYNLGNQTDPGKYRTLASKVTTGSGDVCLKKKSPVATL